MRAVWTSVLMVAALGCERGAAVGPPLQPAQPAPLVDAALPEPPPSPWIIDAGLDAGWVGDLGFERVVHEDAAPPKPDAVPPPTIPGDSDDADGPRLRRPRARRVLVVSVDGMHRDAFALPPAQIPTLTALLRRGASTLDARTDPTRTVTLPNHTCMMTGRPTDGPDGHRVSFNGGSSVTVHDVRGAYTHSLFDVAHAAGLGTALVAGKPKFDLFQRSYAAVLDQSVIHPYDDEPSVEWVLDLLAKGEQQLIFLHLYEADATGHAQGFDPQPDTPYSEAVRRQDARLGRLLAFLPPDAAMIVTTDHGGSGYGHSDPSRPDHFRIPFVVVGPTVTAGADLYALNPEERRHPGAERADPLVPPPIRNCEAGNLAMALLGLPPIPGSTIGRKPLQLGL